MPSISGKNVGNSRAEKAAQKQLATKTGGLATSLPVFAGFETSLAKRFRVEFTTALHLISKLFLKEISGPPQSLNKFVARVINMKQCKLT